MATPLTVILPLASQQTTWSPPIPMMRLIRCSPASCGRSPTNDNVLRTVPPSPSSVSPGVICSAPSQPPGSLNTTTSPLCRSKIPGVSLLTRTRSPTSSVFSIEGDGMKNACTRKVLISSESSSAMPSTTAISLTAPRAARRGDFGARSESLRSPAPCRGPTRSRLPGCRSRSSGGPAKSVEVRGARVVRGQRAGQRRQVRVEARRVGTAAPGQARLAAGVAVHGQGGGQGGVRAVAETRFRESQVVRVAGLAVPAQRRPRRLGSGAAGAPAVPVVAAVRAGVPALAHEVASRPGLPARSAGAVCAAPTDAPGAGGPAPRSARPPSHGSTATIRRRPARRLGRPAPCRRRGRPGARASRRCCCGGHPSPTGAPGARPGRSRRRSDRRRDRCTARRAGDR